MSRSSVLAEMSLPWMNVWADEVWAASVCKRLERSMDEIFAAPPAPADLVALDELPHHDDAAKQQRPALEATALCAIWRRQAQKDVSKAQALRDVITHRLHDIFDAHPGAVAVAFGKGMERRDVLSTLVESGVDLDPERIQPEAPASQQIRDLLRMRRGVLTDTLNAPHQSLRTFHALVRALDAVPSIGFVRELAAACGWHAVGTHRQRQSAFAALREVARVSGADFARATPGIPWSKWSMEDFGSPSAHPVFSLFHGAMKRLSTHGSMTDWDAVTNSCDADTAAKAAVLALQRVHGEINALMREDSRCDLAQLPAVRLAELFAGASESAISVLVNAYWNRYRRGTAHPHPGQASLIDLLVWAATEHVGADPAGEGTARPMSREDLAASAELLGPTQIGAAGVAMLGAMIDEREIHRAIVKAKDDATAGPADRATDHSVVTDHFVGHAADDAYVSTPRRPAAGRGRMSRVL